MQRSLNGGAGSSGAKKTEGGKKGNQTKKKKKRWQPPMFRNWPNSSFSAQNAPLITSASTSRQQRRPMPGVAEIPDSVRMQMLEYGNEPRQFPESKDKRSEHAVSNDPEESYEEDGYGSLFGTNESESSLDIDQEVMRSAGSPGSALKVSKTTVGRTRNSEETRRSNNPLSHSILKYKRKRDASALRAPHETKGRRNTVNFSSHSGSAVKSGTQKKMFVFLDDDEDDDDDDFDDGSFVSRKHTGRIDRASAEKAGGGNPNKRLRETNRNLDCGPFVLCRPTMSACPRPSHQPMGYSWANQHESKFSRLKRVTSDFWEQQVPPASRKEDLSGMLKARHAGQGKLARTTPSKTVGSVTPPRQSTRRGRRRSALDPDLQSAVDAGIMTLEEALKFSGRDGPESSTTKTPTRRGAESRLSDSSASKRSGTRGGSTGAEEPQPKDPVDSCAVSNTSTKRAVSLEKPEHPAPMKRSKRIKKPRRLTKDLQDMVENDYISEKEAWAMMADDIGVPEEQSVEEILREGERVFREDSGFRGDALYESDVGEVEGEVTPGKNPIGPPNIVPSDHEDHMGSDGAIDLEYHEDHHEPATGAGPSTRGEGFEGSFPLGDSAPAIDLVSDAGSSDDDSESGWENPPPVNLDDEDEIGAFHDQEVLLPRHSKFLPFLRTIQDVENGARKLAQCVHGTCSVCANTQKRKYAEDIVQIENLRAQFSSNVSGRKRAPTYKHLNKKKKTTRKKRKGGATRGRGRKRQKNTATSRKRSASAAQKTTRRKRSTAKPAVARSVRSNSRGSQMVNALNAIASRRRFNDSHVFGGSSPRGASFVGGGGEEFDVRSDAYGSGGIYETNPDNVGSGEISWEGQGTLGLDGV